MLMLTLEEPFDMQTLMIINAQSDPGERTKLADTRSSRSWPRSPPLLGAWCARCSGWSPQIDWGPRAMGQPCGHDPFFASIDWAKLARFEAAGAISGVVTGLNEEKTKSAYGKH